MSARGITLRAARIAATGSITRFSETSSRMSAGDRQASTRGGGFLSPEDAEVRITARKLRDVKDRRPDLGFRCAHAPR